MCSKQHSYLSFSHLSVDNLSDSLLAKEDVISDPELPPPSDIDGPRFLTPPSLVNQSPPSKLWLVERALISLSGNANSSSDAEGSPLGAIAKGGGRGTGRSKTTADPTGYIYQGCWQEPQGIKLLTGARAPNNLEDIMTIQVCQTFCAIWPYYGLEYERQCYCGQTLNGGALADPQSQCNIPCVGNSSQICGGPDRVSLYYDSSVPGPNDPPVFDDSNLVACYQETNPRVLDGPSIRDDNDMDLQACSTFCALFNYWGLENGNECYCANALTSPNTVRPQSECNKQCPWEQTQLCGGADRVIIYHRNP
ncbi:WSC domain containing protein [Rhypophila decipiens]